MTVIPLPTRRGHVLIATADTPLLDQLLRLAAAAGVDPNVASSAAGTLRGWSAASLVIVGADLADELARLGPPRRPSVYVTVVGPVPEELYRPALALGAESVVDVGRNAEWFAALLADVDGGTAERALTVAVVGGSGGAGATVFACALASLAARDAPTCLLDLDRYGPGVDRVLGMDAVAGVTWADLRQTSGRLGARSVREALPRQSGLGVLTWGRGERHAVEPDVLREVVAAATRGHRAVIVDLPRTDVVERAELLARCDRVLVVVTSTVAGVASASRVVADVPEPGSVGLVVRGAGAAAESVARAVGAPVLAEMPDQRGLDESIDLGLGPVRSGRGYLARSAAAVLERLSLQVVTA